MAAVRSNVVLGSLAFKRSIHTPAGRPVAMASAWAEAKCVVTMRAASRIRRVSSAGIKSGTVAMVIAEMMAMTTSSSTSVNARRKCSVQYANCEMRERSPLCGDERPTAAFIVL